MTRRPSPHVHFKYPGDRRGRYACGTFRGRRYRTDHNWGRVTCARCLTVRAEKLGTATGGHVTLRGHYQKF